MSPASYRALKPQLLGWAAALVEFMTTLVP